YMAKGRPLDVEQELLEVFRQNGLVNEDLARLFEIAFMAHLARVKGMPCRAVNMLVYLIQHDAHHRGQICALTRDLVTNSNPRTRCASGDGRLCRRFAKCLAEGLTAFTWPFSRVTGH